MQAAGVRFLDQRALNVIGLGPAWDVLRGNVRPEMAEEVPQTQQGGRPAPENGSGFNKQELERGCKRRYRDWEIWALSREVAFPCNFAGLPTSV